MTTRQVAIRLKSEGKAELIGDIRQTKTEIVAMGEAGEAASNGASAAADKQMERYRRLAAAARDAQAAEQRRAEFDRLLGVGGGSGKSARDSADVFLEGGDVLSRQALASRLNLARQGADVLTTAAMGMNPAMIAIQQGPQILDAFATSSIKLSGAMVALGGTIVGVAGTAALLTAAYEHGEAASKKLEVAAHGLGAASRMTGAQLEQAAEQGARAGDVSVKAARDMATAYVNTGRIGGGVLAGLIGMTRDYAATTGEDAAAATKELAAAFADPARGAAELNAKLNFLNPAELQHIENLARAGDAAGAQRLMIDALKQSLVDAADAANGFGNEWDVIARKASDAWDKLGQVLYRIMSGGDNLTKIAQLEARRQRFDTPLARLVYPQEVQRIDSEIAQIQAKITAEEQRQARAADNQHQAEVQAVLDRSNPSAARLNALRADANRLTAELALDPLAGNAKQLSDALHKTQTEISAIEHGYASAAAQAAALTREQRTGQAAARDQAREAEEAARKVKALDDLDLQNRTAVARATGDQETIKLLEREARLRSLILTYEQNGVDAEEARARAQSQVTREASAEAEARRRHDLSNPEGFKTTEELMRPYQNLTLDIDASSAAMKRFKAIGSDALDHVGDMIAQGKVGWDDWKQAGLEALREILAEAIRMAAINPLKNMLFGENNPTMSSSGGGLAAFARWGLSAASSFFGSGGSQFSADAARMGTPVPGIDAEFAGGFGSIGANATGTSYWRGGPTWVGEQGPELLDLPRGARIFDARRSQRMASDLARPIEVHVHANDIESLTRPQSRGQVIGTIARALQLAARTN